MSGAPVFAATAPGSIGNFGPGLDILGCALTGPGDTVRVRRAGTPGVVLEDAGHPELPTDPELHASAIAARAVLDAAGAQDVGVALHVVKGLPLCGGQGGSAASAVAGAVATNALLGTPLDRQQLLVAALAAEERVAGRHADNVAPALMGGIVLVRSVDPLDVIPLPVPDALRVVLVHPHQQLRTKEARAVLPPSLPLGLAVHQAAHVGALVAALASGDLDLVGRALDDRIAETARAPLLPGFRDAKAAAMEAGALGCSISGAGPTAFALAADDDRARAIAAAMVAAYARCGVPSASRVARIDRAGAQVAELREPAPV